MKHIYIILTIFLFSFSFVSAQDAKKLESFKITTLQKYNMYFNNAELNESGKLKLSALDKYSQQNTEEKKAIIQKINLEWQDSIVIVSYGTKRELWGWNSSTKTTQLLDIFDFGKQPSSLIPALDANKTALHPWFFYVGGFMTGDNQKNMSFSFNTRLGFFLLKNRWDLATTFSAGTIEVGDTASSNFTSFGLMSRVYFPIKNVSVFPNIGGDITLGDDGASAGLLVGARWHFNMGSLDFGVRFGNEVRAMLGYTFFPTRKSKKR